MTELTHYGVKGMRWGVRKRPKKPGLDSRGLNKLRTKLLSGESENPDYEWRRLRKESRRNLRYLKYKKKHEGYKYSREDRQANRAYRIQRTARQAMAGASLASTLGAASSLAYSIGIHPRQKAQRRLLDTMSDPKRAEEFSSKWRSASDKAGKYGGKLGRRAVGLAGTGYMRYAGIKASRTPTVRMSGGFNEPRLRRERKPNIFREAANRRRAAKTQRSWAPNNYKQLGR